MFKNEKTLNAISVNGYVSVEFLREDGIQIPAREKIIIKPVTTAVILDLSRNGKSALEFSGRLIGGFDESGETTEGEHFFHFSELEELEKVVFVELKPTTFFQKLEIRKVIKKKLLAIFPNFYIRRNIKRFFFSPLKLIFFTFLLVWFLTP